MYISSTQRSQRRPADPLELELHKAVSQRVGTENGTQVLWNKAVLLTAPNPILLCLIKSMHVCLLRGMYMSAGAYEL